MTNNNGSGKSLESWIWDVGSRRGIGELKGQDSAIKNIQEIHVMLNGASENKDITVTQIRCF